METSPLSAKEALRRLDVSSSTYYRWRKRFRGEGVTGLLDRSPYRGRVWNELLGEERVKVLEVARLYPEWSPREVACHISDLGGLYGLGIVRVAVAEKGGVGQTVGEEDVSSRTGIYGEDPWAK